MFYAGENYLPGTYIGQSVESIRLRLVFCVESNHDADYLQ